MYSSEKFSISSKSTVSSSSTSFTSAAASERMAGAAGARRNIGLLFAMMASVLILSMCFESTHCFVAGSRPLSKRSFFDIQCKGVYDKAIFGRLDRICDDCYNLYREPQLHALCRSNCFGSPYFKGCLDALLLNEDEAKYEEMIEILGKKK